MMRVHENVVNLVADTASILNLYQALIDLSAEAAGTRAGVYEPVAAQGDVLLYRRRGDGKARW